MPRLASQALAGQTIPAQQALLDARLRQNNACGQHKTKFEAQYLTRNAVKHRYVYEDRTPHASCGAHCSSRIWLGALDAAYDWLCKTRADAPSDSDVWNLRRNWTDLRPGLARLLAGNRYRLRPLVKIRCDQLESSQTHRWTSRDALVLKAMTYLLAPCLPASRHCTHLAGHGGVKGAVRRVVRAAPHHRVQCRTDVKSYYASIDHFKLLDRVADHVTDKVLLNLLGQYLRRTVEYGGTFVDIEKGISAGCPLSPLMGAFYLYELDRAMAQKHPRCFYVRFMDDILILAPSRWQLRRAITTMNACLQDLGLEKHPDKTSMGPVSRGFDFLGYELSPSGLKLARKTLSNYQTKLSRLYERYRKRRIAPDAIEAALKTYTRRFKAWAQGGLHVHVPLTETVFCLSD